MYERLQTEVGHYLKTIAVCLNIEELAHEGLESPQICQKYPGSGWLPYLRLYAMEKGVQVLSGHRALEQVRLNELNPKDVVVLQEEMNVPGTLLRSYGATGGVLFCLEAPLYTPFFYDELPHLIPHFKYQLLFQGGSHRVYFPSFDLKEIPEPMPLSDRKPNYCMVMSNKYYAEYSSQFKDSPTWQHAVQHQLHDKRYAAIAYLKGKMNLDLYGKGWPFGFGKEIPVGEKISVIREYPMYICDENMTMEGYVTEKVIDCLVAGVIPLYTGAPNIEEYVPLNCMLTNRDAPLSYKVADLIQNGQKFIRSAAAKKFSYQGWAEQVLNLADDCFNQSS